MKLFILILSLFGSLSAMSQVGEDPNDLIAKDGSARQGVFLDNAHQAALKSYSIATEPACPGCGDVSLLGDSTNPAARGSNDTGSTGQDADSMGP